MNADRDAWIDPLREGERGPDAKGMFMWVGLVAGPIWDIAGGRSHPVWLAWPGVLAAGALYLRTVHLAFADQRRAQWRALPPLAAVTLADVAVFRGNWFYLLVMLAIAVGTAVRGRAMPLTLFALCAVGVAIRLAAGASVPDALILLWGMFTAGIIPAIVIRLWEAIWELQRTREELAEAAVAQERLRFARDLHDLLGHTLSVIVVKAEAVRRLAPRDADAAARQAADIERIGREALTEVRAAVTGYRGRGLTAELESARTALADAGITAVIRTCAVRLTPEVDALLGWAVREGVTNVIRHSGARSCQIDLRGDDGVVLDIRDDGTAGRNDLAAPKEAAPGEAGKDAARRAGAEVRAVGRHRQGPGHGLKGLRERVTALGGTLEAGPLAGRGFLLRVVVPEKEESR